ncbi:sugar phosphate nucleotidyltransferase [Paenibacillus lautus]|uniref:sugar phosphate nucleotidyltransferase n=1 Tax=Paenibacillus lautus TaxID=1401 RepID=UPI003D2CE825
MRLVLISGGAGKRLWPLSSEDRPKQFIPLFSNNEGTMISMTQRVWEQINECGLFSHVYVSTIAEHESYIKKQLGKDVSLILEPCCKDTYAAISLVVSYLKCVENIGPNEIIAIVPIDCYVEVDFFQYIHRLQNVIREKEPQIALLGVKPSYPAESYGYIKTSDQNNPQLNASMSVEQFVEKPREQLAKRLIAEQALWNCGVVAFRLGEISSLYEANGVELSYDKLLYSYDTLPSTSFDYGITEKARHIEVLPYNGPWKDIGTWDALSEELPQSVIGNGKICENSVNTHLLNELEIPILVLGLKDVIVTAGKHGILVAAKSHSSTLKNML